MIPNQRQCIVPGDVFDSRPYGFSQAVVAEPGTTVHVSGQVGWDPQHGAAGVTLVEQVPAAFDNLERVLRACGGAIDDVVALRIYVVASADDLAPVGEELRRRFSQPPAATWLRVAGLAAEEMLVEVEATAVLTDS